MHELKQQIAKRFSQAAQHYDNLAQIQQQIVADALRLFGDGAGYCVDLGCGTSQYGEKLAAQCEKLVNLDLSFGMLRHANLVNQVGVPAVCADAEYLPFKQHTIQRVFSCMAMQWCNEPRRVFDELYRVLTPGADGLVAVMTQGSFQQWDECWADRDKHHNRFHSSQFWRSVAKQAGFRVNAEVKHYCDYHQSIKAMFDSVRKIGAGVVAQRRSKLTRQDLLTFKHRYMALQDQTGRLPLDYYVTFLSFSKP